SGGGGGGRIAIYYSDATGFNLGTQVLVTGGTGNGAPNGEAGTIHLQQQVAMFTPMFEQAPVMKADAENSSAGGRVHLAPAEIKNTKSDIQENLYLALLASSSTRGTSEIRNPKSEGESPKFTDLSVFPNPKSKIQNPKLMDDLDPIYTYDLNGNRTSMI